MQYKYLGKTKERVPVLGLGTWRLTSPNALETLQYGFERGIRYVDTAELYKTEHLVGEAIKGYRDILVATKVFTSHFRYKDVIKACNASLKKLGIKTIDLYQLHWPNPEIPIAETMAAMEKLVEQGKIRYIGVCNFSVREVVAAQEALKKNEVVSNQVEYSLLVRDAEKEMLNYCAHEKITLIAYSPLNRGHLYDKKYSELLALLSRIGKRYSKTHTQVAVNWLIRKRPVVAIPKASSREHVEELLGSVNFKLRNEDMKLIDDYLSNAKKQLWPPSLPEVLQKGLSF